MRYALGDLDAFRLERRDLVRIVCEQPDFIDAEGAQHRGGVGVVALVVGEAQAQVRVDRVEPAVLERIGAQLVGETNSAPFLPQVEQHAAASRSDQPQRLLQLRPAIAL